MKDLSKIRDTILTAAAGLFERYGYDKTSMDEIASAARKAKASIYYHFDSKLSIFKAVLQQEMSGVIGQLKKIVEEETEMPEQISMYLKKRMDIIKEAKVYNTHLMTSYIRRNDEISEAVAQARQLLDKYEYGYFHDICTKGREMGVLSEAVKPDAFGKTMTVLMRSIEIQFASYEDEAAMKSTYDAMVEILVTNQFASCSLK